MRSQSLTHLRALTCETGVASTRVVAAGSHLCSGNLPCAPLPPGALSVASRPGDRPMVVSLAMMETAAPRTGSGTDCGTSVAEMEVCSHRKVMAPPREEERAPAAREGVWTWRRRAMCWLETRRYEMQLAMQPVSPPQRHLAAGRATTVGRPWNPLRRRRRTQLLRVAVPVPVPVAVPVLW